MANKIKAVVINPAKKTKRKTARRKMSALQLKYFGKKRKISKVSKRRKTAPKIKIIEVKSMAKRRKRRAVSSAPKRRKRIFHNPVSRKRRSRRHVYRNPSSFSGITDILVNGAFGGVSAFALLYVSDIISEKFLSAPASAPDAATKAKRNLCTIALAVLGGWAAMKYVKGKRGEAIATGMVSGAALRLAVNMFGLNIGLGEASNVDSVLDNLLKGETLLGGGGETLLGMDDSLFGDEINFDDDGISGVVDDDELSY